jgi:hypothetical protein
VPLSWSSAKRRPRVKETEPEIRIDEGRKEELEEK